MRYLLKFGMLLNVSWVVEVLLRPEFDLSNLVVGILGFSLSFVMLVFLDLQDELTMFKFLQQVSRVLINNATHDEIDELRRQLNSGLTGNAAKYTRELFEKYEKKDG